MQKRLPTPPFRRHVGYRVAILLWFVAFQPGCGGRESPVQSMPVRPDEEASTSVHNVVPAPSPAPAAAMQPTVIGWFCPTGATSGPSIRPLWLQTGDGKWTAESNGLKKALASRAARQLSVLAWRGGTAGVFSVAGLGKIAGTPQAIGTYVGASICDLAQKPGEPKKTDPTCEKLVGGCGWAYGPMEPSGGFLARPYEEGGFPARRQFPSRAVCLVGNVLLFGAQQGSDVGQAFDVSQILTRALQAPRVVPLHEGPATSCEPGLGYIHIKGGNRANPVLFVAKDVDGDGLEELLVYRDCAFLLYRIRRNDTQLELVGSAPSHLCLRSPTARS